MKNQRLTMTVICRN